MFSASKVRFLPFIDFLCAERENLLKEPFRGNLDHIRMLFNEYAGTETSDTNNVNSFMQFIRDFNGISVNALVFSQLLYGAEKVDQIKMTNVLLLKKWLETSDGQVSIDLVFPTTRSSISKPVQKLEQLLNLPLRTLGVEKVDGESVNIYDLDKLCKAIAKSSAREILGVERAKLLTPVKPFYEVCCVAKHNQTLANLCLTLKSIGQSVLDLPSNAKMHKAITSCKGLISKEILNCVKSKVHFLPLMTSCTDIYLGNCSYLDTCHKLKSCRYLHYYTLNPSLVAEAKDANKLLALDYTIGECYNTITKKELPAQWIKCDVRYLPFNILGKFAAIISDPAWDIHMSLPYGTCKDSELLSLHMEELQDEGILFLWVTGRSIEIGRRALHQWGYTVSDEMIWIKLNQLRRTIVTGRTGHWLNHSKEHLLVGIKGNPIWLNRKIDLDYIVSGTRETLRKPDELYGIIDRLVGRHSRKLEIFGRDNNIRPGWLSTYIRLTSYKYTNGSNWQSGDWNLDLREGGGGEVQRSPGESRKKMTIASSSFSCLPQSSVLQASPLHYPLLFSRPTCSLTKRRSRKRRKRVQAPLLVVNCQSKPGHVFRGKHGHRIEPTSKQCGSL